MSPMPFMAKVSVGFIGCAVGVLSPTVKSFLPYGAHASGGLVVVGLNAAEQEGAPAVPPGGSAVTQAREEEDFLSCCSLAPEGSMGVMPRLVLAGPPLVATAFEVHCTALALCLDYVLLSAIS